MTGWKTLVGLGIFGFVFWCVIAPFATPLSFGEIVLIGIGLAVFAVLGGAADQRSDRAARNLGLKLRERRLARKAEREERGGK